jgi:hypothetical protein
MTTSACSGAPQSVALDFDVKNMPRVASRVRKMARRIALRDLEFGSVDEALFLIQVADLIDAQYDALRPITPRERGVRPGWPKRVLRRVLGGRASA